MSLERRTDEVKDAGFALEITMPPVKGRGRRREARNRAVPIPVSPIDQVEDFESLADQAPAVGVRWPIPMMSMVLRRSAAGP